MKLKVVFTLIFLSISFFLFFQKIFAQQPPQPPQIPSIGEQARDIYEWFRATCRSEAEQCSSIDLACHLRNIFSGLTCTINHLVMTPFRMALLLMVMAAYFVAFYTVVVADTLWTIFYQVLPWVYNAPIDVRTIGDLGQILNLTTAIGNGFIVLSFVFVGVATILGIRPYTIRENLGRLVSIALLLNFAFLLVIAATQIGNTISQPFFESAQLLNFRFYNYMNAVFNSIRGNLFTITTNTNIFLAWPETVAQAAAIIGVMVLIVTVSIFFILPYLIVIIFLLFRTIFIWILQIVAPLAFATLVFGRTQAIRSIFIGFLNWEGWLRDVLSWAFAIIPFAFVVYLTSYIAPATSLLSYSIQVVFQNWPQGWGLKLIGDALVNIFPSLISVVTLGMAVGVIVKELPGAIQGLLNRVYGFAGQLSGMALGMGIASLGKGFSLAGQFYKGIASGASKIWDWIKTTRIGGKTWDWMKNTRIGRGIGKTWDWMKNTRLGRGVKWAWSKTGGKVWGWAAGKLGAKKAAEATTKELTKAAATRIAGIVGEEVGAKAAARVGAKAAARVGAKAAARVGAKAAARVGTRLGTRAAITAGGKIAGAAATVGTLSWELYQQRKRLAMIANLPKEIAPLYEQYSKMDDEALRSQLYDENVDFKRKMAIGMVLGDRGILTDKDVDVLADVYNSKIASGWLSAEWAGEKVMGKQMLAPEFLSSVLSNRPALAEKFGFSSKEIINTLGIDPTRINSQDVAKIYNDLGTAEKVSLLKSGSLETRAYVGERVLDELGILSPEDKANLSSILTPEKRINALENIVSKNEQVLWNIRNNIREQIKNPSLSQSEFESLRDQANLIYDTLKVFGKRKLDNKNKKL